MSKEVLIKRALISVSDKTGLISLAKTLMKKKVEILSTGGTLKALRAAGVAAKAVEEVTQFPEILDGRVKTLHPKIHGGLLFRRKKAAHKKEAKKHGIGAIDLVIVNLYPFERVTQDPSVKLEQAIENIDIGGPSMLRSAAKNHEDVTVLCDSEDYAAFLAEFNQLGGKTSLALRFELAQKVFARTSAYDQAIAGYLKQKQKTKSEKYKGLPETLDVVYVKGQELRYGENPHQRAALYQAKDRQPRFQLKQLHGKELSFNNLLDIEATVDILREFSEPAACVVKHNNPCGVSEGGHLVSAMEAAIECDAMSAFGGILGVNRPLDKQTAERATEQLRFFEVFVAPAFETSALKLLQRRKNLRLIETGELGLGGPYDMRFVKEGILLQDRDTALAGRENEIKKSLKCVTKKKISSKELDDLIFAWKCVKIVKSNAIVLTQGRQTVGIGAGQMSRVDSVFIACQKAGFRSDGAFLASDAFFPMPDAVEEAHEHGIRAIIQPGGSIRDADIIQVCDRHGMAMVLTGQRHFRH